MKLACTLLFLLLSISALSESRLDCYEKYFNDIRESDSLIIQNYLRVYEIEKSLLDQYFYPEKYTKKVHFEYMVGRKQNLLNVREQYKQWVDSKILHSRELSVNLSFCLDKNSI